VRAGEEVGDRLGAALAAKDAAALRAMFDDRTIMSGIRVGMLLRHEHAADVHDQAAV
jgi:hypothetical protein